MAKSAFLESMNFVSYSPTNVFAYLLRAISSVTIMLIFYYRYLVVGIVSEYFLLFVAAAFFPWTRSFAMTIFTYGAVMLFSRFIMCMVLLGGTGLMSGFPAPLSEAPNRSRAAGHLMTIVFLMACLTMPCPSHSRAVGYND